MYKRSRSATREVAMSNSQCSENYFFLTTGYNHPFYLLLASHKGDLNVLIAFNWLIINNNSPCKIQNADKYDSKLETKTYPKLNRVRRNKTETSKLQIKMRKN